MPAPIVIARRQKRELWPIHRRMWGMTSFGGGAGYGAANGELGSATGFGWVIWYFIGRGVGERVLLKSGSGGGYFLDKQISSSHGFVWYCYDGGGTSRSVLVSYPPSWTQMVVPVVCRHNGAANTISVQVGLTPAVRASTACTGYTAAPGSQQLQLGVGGALTTESAIISALSFRGVPTDQQMEDYLRSCVAGGFCDLLASLAGATNLRRYRFRTSIPTVTTLRSRTGDTAPATLFEDQLGENLARAASPKLKRIQGRVDKRRAYGVIGGEANTVIASAAGAGIRGSAVAFTVWCDVLLNTGGLYVFFACSDSSENGWTLYNNGATIYLIVRDGTGVSRSVSAVVTNFANTRCRISVRFTGLQAHLYVNGLSAGYVDCVGYTPAGAGVKMGLLNRGSTLSWPSRTAIMRAGGGSYASTAAEHEAWGKKWGQRVIEPFKPGYDEHDYDLYQDVLGNGGAESGVPAIILDRIGTDHLTTAEPILAVLSGGLTRFGPSGYAQSRSVASGLPGIATAFWVEILLDVGAASGAVQTLFSNTGAGATGVAVKMAANNVPFALVYNGSGFANAQGASALSVGRHHIGLRYDGTNAQLYVDGVASGAAAGPVTLWPGDQPTKLGTLTAGTSEPVTSHALRGVAGGHFVPSAGEMSAASTYALANGKVGGISGKTLRLYSLVDDVIEAGGNVPATFKERINGETLTVVGSGITICEQTEHLMQFDESVLAYSSDAHGSAIFYASTLDDASSASGWWHAFLIWAPIYTGVSRVIAGAASGSTGWDFRLGTNNTTASWFIGDGSAFSPSGNAGIDPGRLNLIVCQWDAINGRQRTYARRAEVGSGVARTAFAPAASTKMRFGCSQRDTGSAGLSYGFVGFAKGHGLLTFAEVLSLYDSTKAHGKIVAVPRKTQTLYDWSRDFGEAGGLVTSTVQDRIGSDHLTASATPCGIATHYAQAWSW